VLVVKIQYHKQINHILSLIFNLYEGALVFCVVFCLSLFCPSLFYNSSSSHSSISDYYFGIVKLSPSESDKSFLKSSGIIIQQIKKLILNVWHYNFNYQHLPLLFVLCIMYAFDMQHIFYARNFIILCALKIKTQWLMRNMLS